jgi:uncharacterized membrane protein
MGFLIMRWNYKMDVIVMCFSVLFLALIALLAGIIVPIISNIRRGNMWALLPIAGLIALIAFMIYLFKFYKRKGKD